MVDDHYVTREEYQQLLALAQPKKRGGGFFAAALNFITWLLICVGAAGGIAFVLFLKTDLFMVDGAAPQSTSAPAATPPRTIPTPGTSGDGEAPTPSLPDCATVTDSRTACAGAVGELPQGQAEEATPVPLELAPAAVECWQGSFYTCDELAEMGDEQAIEAVQATDAFIDPATLPTPAPAFVEYATDACAKAETKSILCP